MSREAVFWIGVFAGFAAHWFLAWCRRLDVFERTLTEPGGWERSLRERGRGFGGGEVIEVDLPLGRVRVLLEQALQDRTLVEFRDDGEVIVINPTQVKVLRESVVALAGSPPEPGDAT